MSREHDTSIEQEPMRFEESEILEERIEVLEKERVTAIKGIGSFAKKSMLVLGLLFSLIMIGTIYDATMTASSMMHNAPVLGVFYLVLLFALLGIVGVSILKQWRGYQKLKRIDSLQERAKAFALQPRGVKAYAKEVLSVYKNHENSEIATLARTLDEELPTLLESEVLERLDEKLFQALDRLARASIVKYANQTALSTAISPVALIDAVLILSRSHVMVHEIANIYGYRPNLLGEIALFKKVFAVLAFASVTDILANHSHDILGTSILSKLSLHGAQGVANGILVARVGIGAIQSCRPLSYKEKGGGFLKSLSKVMMEALFRKKDTAL